MIEFAYPWMFILIILPLFIYWLAPEYKQQKSSLQVPYFERLVYVTGEQPKSGAVVLNRLTIQKLLLLIAWLCLVTAMAKPEIIGEPIIQKKSARDLMVAVDLSGSMAVEDFKTQEGKVVNRLVAVKQVLSDFVEQRKGDRLGLILFGDAPYLQAPFTADLSTWLTLLNEADIGMAGQSTAFGDAIGLSINVFQHSEAQNRVLIVLTDGNDTHSKVPPIEAAKVAAAHNIKIYTIAIGDPQAVGEEKVDLAVLEQMALLTAGQSFQAVNRDELQLVYQQIASLESQLFETRSFRPKTSAHHYPIIIFVCIYLLPLLTVTLRIRLQARKR